MQYCPQPWVSRIFCKTTIMRQLRRWNHPSSYLPDDCCFTKKLHETLGCRQYSMN